MAALDKHVIPHDHDHPDDNHCHMSTKYTEYIKIHLQDLQAKCTHLTVCINKLLSQQSPISVLKGDDLELKKICELINVQNNRTGSMLDGKCSIHERMDIMMDVENHLKDRMEKKNNWENVAVCLENNYGDNERTTYIGDICGVVDRSGEVCSYNTHKQVEKFINEQIDHLQCTCKALHRDTGHNHHSDMSTAAIVGIGVGGLLFLCLLFGLVYFCCRRKQKKRKKKKGPNVIYLPAANSDNCPVYQEIFDQRSSNPPTLPSRYMSRPLPGSPDDVEYLEPAQAQAASGSYRAKAPAPLHKLVNNPGYEVEAPPEYSETDQMYEDAVLMDADAANAYFDPVATPKTEKTDGYDTLNVGENNNEDNHTSLPDEYQVLEDIDTDRKLGPPPDQRMKKEDRPTESEYFELEKVVQEVH